MSEKEKGTLKCVGLPFKEVDAVIHECGTTNHQLAVAKKIEGHNMNAYIIANGNADEIQQQAHIVAQTKNVPILYNEECFHDKNMKKILKDERKKSQEIKKGL